MKNSNSKEKVAELAGSSNRKQKPTHKQKKVIDSQIQEILKTKDLLETMCSNYDEYIKEENLDIFPIDNPFNANRLNELLQAHVNKLTLGNIGGGCDSIEGYEFKVIKYPGVNYRTNRLNAGSLYFNGPTKFDSWREQCEFLRDEYLSKIKGIDTAIRLPNGKYLHFVSRMDQYTINFLLEKGKLKYKALEERAEDPRMRLMITTTELLQHHNFKLLKNSPSSIYALAKEYLGETYYHVM
jgi:hypothetical protein